MKKEIKYLIIGIFIGAIVFGTTGILASTYLQSSNVSYNETDVQHALDDLYTKSLEGDATDNQLLSGKTALVGGSKIVGSLPNIGSVNKTINPGESYTIPEGYHNGNGIISASPNVNTYTFANNSKGEIVDLGVNNLIRYIDATNVYNKGLAEGESNLEISKLAGGYKSYSSTGSGTKLTYSVTSETGGIYLMIGFSSSKADAGPSVALNGPGTDIVETTSAGGNSSRGLFRFRILKTTSEVSLDVIAKATTSTDYAATLAGYIFKLG